MGPAGGLKCYPICEAPLKVRMQSEVFPREIYVAAELVLMSLLVIFPCLGKMSSRRPPLIAYSLRSFNEFLRLYTLGFSFIFLERGIRFSQFALFSFSHFHLVLGVRSLLI